MRSDWLAVANFERMQEILSAINTLSIHAKLTLANVQDPTPVPEVEQARARLSTFLERLSAVVTEASRDGEATFVGSDPRLGELAQQFLSGSEYGRREMHLSPQSLATLLDLVRSDLHEDLRRMVPDLQELRTLLEEQVQADVVGVLGDVE